MSKKKICIDISNIVPGKGGSGGGIATYSLNLIKSLNKTYNINELSVYCIKHSKFKGFEDCTNIKFININLNIQNFIYRIFWIQVYLPFFCAWNKIFLLHRVTPELPVIKFCKYVCTLHDLMFDFYISNSHVRKFLSKSNIVKFYIFRAITRHALYVSDCVIVPSNTIKNEVVRRYKTDHNKIFTIYEASENSESFANPQEISNPLPLNIGVIAGFYPHKGHLKVLELAHNLIRNGFTEFRISFRGNPAFPDFIKEVNNLKEKLSLNDYIIFVPFKTDVKLHEIYSEFDLILLLSEYEGFGLPVLEAQAHNLPVFCSDIEIFREILGTSAYYINSDFNTIVIENLTKTFKNQSILNSFKEAGLSNAKKYSWERMSLETNDLYIRLI